MQPLGRMYPLGKMYPLNNSLNLGDILKMTKKIQYRLCCFLNASCLRWKTYYSFLCLVQVKMPMLQDRYDHAGIRIITFFFLDLLLVAFSLVPITWKQKDYDFKLTIKDELRKSIIEDWATSNFINPKFCLHQIH